MQIKFNISGYTYMISQLLFICVFALACNKTPDLAGFDNEAWKQDLNGCNHTRLNGLNELKSIIDQLKGLNQQEIVAILGKPESKELYKRSQKFFIYQISPKNDCQAVSYSGANITLNIRFTAMGLAKEILIYKD